jgi:hypothetical protein
MHSQNCSLASSAWIFRRCPTSNPQSLGDVFFCLSIFSFSVPWFLPWISSIVSRLINSSVSSISVLSLSILLVFLLSPLILSLRPNLLAPGSSLPFPSLSVSRLPCFLFFPRSLVETSVSAFHPFICFPRTDRHHNLKTLRRPRLIYTRLKA